MHPHRPTVRFAFAALAAAVLGLAGCTVNPATGEQSFTPFMSPAQEKEIGREEHPKILKQFGGAYDDPQVADYVERIGQRLAAVSEMPDLRFTFTVLNDDMVNAFALPGGYVYLTRGLLALATDEAEMAGVLGHEIGHVVARHTAERYSQAVAANLGLTLLGVLTNAPTGVGEIVSYGAQAYLQSFSREQELEADMLGGRYMARTGYDLSALTSFLEKMQAHQKLEARLSGDPDRTDQFDIMATHPRTSDRIARALQLAGLPANGPRGRYPDAFMRRIDGMLYGDDPRQGVRRGQEFLHPDLRLAFRVPEGFRLINTPERVLARGPGESLIAFDLASRQAARETPDVLRYLVDVWARNVPLSNVERLTVNGLPGATGTTRVGSSAGPRDLRAVAVRDGPERIFRFQFYTPPNLTARLATDLQRTTYSLRVLSPAEAADIRPLRVRAFRLDAATPVASLAAEMPFGRDNVDWFRVLNGLSAAETTVPAGAWIKVVEG